MTPPPATGSSTSGSSATSPASSTAAAWAQRLAAAWGPAAAGTDQNATDQNATDQNGTDGDTVGAGPFGHRWADAGSLDPSNTTGPLRRRSTATSDGNSDPLDATARQRRSAITPLRRSPGALRAAPLPVAFRPLADAIVGDRDVTVAHDATARAALRAAGTSAAAIGRTILLDRAPTDTAAVREKIAHELTHVAHNVATGAVGDPARDAGLVPRFFADPHRDHEERTAEKIGRLARTLLPTPAVTPPTGGPSASISASVGDPGGSSASSSPIRRRSTRTATASAPTASARSTTSARSTASGPTAAAASTVVRRTPAPASSSPSSSTSPSTSSTAGSGETTVRRLVAPTAPTASTAASTGGDDSPGRESATDRLDRLDELVALVEARVLAELERRGGRHRGWI